MRESATVFEQGIAANKMIFMTQSADHVTGATGLTLTITASKDGGAFASITPTVSERGNGWYNLALTTAHLDTLGDFVLRITGTGADPTDLSCFVKASPELEGAVSDVAPAAGGFDTDLTITDDVLNGAMLYFITGTLKGHGRKIADSFATNGALDFTDTDALATPFPAAPANGDKFRIISFGGKV